MQLSVSRGGFLILPLALAITSQAYAAEPKATRLDQVVVTATSQEQDANLAPATIATISGDAIQKSAGSLTEALRQVPGIELERAGSAGRQKISIRGLNSSHTLILVNGRRVDSSEALFRGNDFDLNTVPANNIERVEVVRGPMSSLYGADALGGVINIITKKAGDKWHGSISQDFTDTHGNDGGNDRKSAFSLSGALIPEQLTLSLSGSVYHRDPWTPYKDDSSTVINEAGITALEKKDQRSLRAELDWYINDQQQLTFDIASNKDKRRARYALGRNQTPNVSHDINRLTTGLTHKGDWEWGSSTVRAYQEKARLNEDVPVMRGPNRIFDPATITETSQVAEGSVTLELLENHQLTTGGEVRHIRLDNKRDVVGGTSKTTRKALFAQDEWFLTDDLTLTWGGRIDDDKDFGHQFSPRAYLVYTATDRLTLKGGYGEAFKAPTMSQLNPDFKAVSCAGGCVIAGDKNLKPEEAKNTEFSSIYTADTWSVSGTVFYSKVKNLIRPQPVARGFKGTRLYENVTRVRIRGVELAGDVDLLDNLKLSASYTYTDARNSDTKRLLAERPRDTLNVTLNWQPVADLNSFIRVNRIGEQEVLIRRGPNTTRADLPAYNLVDLGLSYQLHKNLSVRGGMTNLKNVRLKEKDSNFQNQPRGRAVYAGITASF